MSVQKLTWYRAKRFIIEGGIDVIVTPNGVIMGNEIERRESPGTR